MNLQSDTQLEVNGTLPRFFPAGTAGAQSATPFLHRESSIGPYEFRSLTGLEVQMPKCDLNSGQSLVTSGACGVGLTSEGWSNPLGDSLDIKASIDQARQEGFDEGDRQGRSAARADSEAEVNTAVERQRQTIVEAIAQFAVARERYFSEVELEVVRLALAIAARVLHREATIDPLLLSGVVRVAMEKMADRTGVVIRVAAGDAAAWSSVFDTTEPREQPRVMEDARLKRGECALDTTMGTVELGVTVQLEEIEKGFFDLLSRRPAQ